MEELARVSDPVSALVRNDAICTNPGLESLGDFVIEICLDSFDLVFWLAEEGGGEADEDDDKAGD